MSLQRPLESLSDDELLSRLADLLRQSRRVEAPLVAHIGEVDARGLFARHASPSMFVYCTDVLHLSEAEAYLRITAARAAREHPLLLEMLADGRLHLTGLAKLAPHLTPENRAFLLSRAVHKTKRQIEELLAEIAPRPDVPSVLRKLPDRPSPGEEPRLELGPDGAPHAASPSPPDAAPRPATAPVTVVEPLSPSRYKVQFTAGRELHDDLERLRALLRSEVPDGDLATIIALAVREKRQRLEARRFARTSSSRERQPRTDSSSRHVPAAVRRAVYRRDGGRCRFVDAQGRRCPERHCLEFHHRHPFALGGGHDPGNICLMCPAHNRYLAEIDYGRTTMTRYQQSGPGSPGNRRRAQGYSFRTESQGDIGK